MTIVKRAFRVYEIFIDPDRDVNGETRRTSKLNVKVLLKEYMSPSGPAIFKRGVTPIQIDQRIHKWNFF